MPRDLADVIGDFIPEAALDAPRDDPAAPEGKTGAPAGGVLSTSVGIPIGREDPVRMAIAWNLGIRLSRMGNPCTLVARGQVGETSPWPEPDDGSPRLRSLRVAPTERLEPESAPGERRLVLDCVDASSVPAAANAAGAPAVWLLLARPMGEDLRQAYRQALAIGEAQPAAHIGATIHGVGQIEEARSAFERLAVAVDEDSGVGLFSFGLLVDDLQLYHSMNNRRPLGTYSLNSPACNALDDLAGLLLADLDRTGGDE